MRRFSTRKRNKINLQSLNKKAIKTLVVFIILLIIILFVYFYYIKNAFIKNIFEKHYTSISKLNEETVFSLNKIIIFSSATVNPKELKNGVWNMDVSQYSDISIYLNNITNDSSQKNIVKELYIDNISISDTEYGSPYLYKKSLYDFGKCSFKEENILSDRLDFSVISEGKEINYNNSEILTDLSTPICIGFYNKNIKSDFLNANSEIEYNGKILKRANIPIASMSCNLSFCINIINELDEHYVCNVNIDIPFEDENYSIYNDGYITQEINNLDNYKFLRIK